MESRRRHGGRPYADCEFCDVIRRVHENGWGAPQIRGELLKLGLDVSERSRKARTTDHHAIRKPMDVVLSFSFPKETLWQDDNEDPGPDTQCRLHETDVAERNAGRDRLGHFHLITTNQFSLDIDCEIIRGYVDDQEAMFTRLKQRHGLSRNAIKKRASALGIDRKVVEQLSLSGLTYGLRPCLRCEKGFLSRGAGNRLCPKCIKQGG
jgi:hypothetical protein